MATYGQEERHTEHTRISGLSRMYGDLFGWGSNPLGRATAKPARRARRLLYPGLRASGQLAAGQPRTAVLIARPCQRLRNLSRPGPARRGGRNVTIRRRDAPTKAGSRLGSWGRRR